jgi:hypothetical protein
VGKPGRGPHEGDVRHLTHNRLGEAAIHQIRGCGRGGSAMVVNTGLPRWAPRGDPHQPPGLFAADLPAPPPRGNMRLLEPVAGEFLTPQLEKFCWCTVRRSAMSISSWIARSGGGRALAAPDSHVRREIRNRSPQSAANELHPELTAIGITEARSLRRRFVELRCENPNAALRISIAI